jgi:C1A family cysteine protease
MSEEGSKQRSLVTPTAGQRSSLNLQRDASLPPNIKANAGLLNTILPASGVFSIDYSLANNLLVSPVKDQGACGSCWAFAGIADLESYYMKRHKMLLDLSEQQMVDCVTAVLPNTVGCSGGQGDSVAYYAVLFGVAQEKYYPY